MSDLRDGTTLMATEIGRLLNGDKPVQVHTIGFIIVTFPFGPSQPAHYASNTDPGTLVSVLEHVIKDIQSRPNILPPGTPQSIVVPPH
jgi:hypothetical protein